jgi:phosphoglycolate phosphatase-like HAD superfamily hydrolase
MGDLLVLWDVDGTLLDAGGVGSELYGIVFTSMFGRRCEKVAPMAGRTDRAIILDTLEMAGIPEPRRHVDPFIEGLREHSQLVFQAAKQRGKALPGAADALAALASATVGKSTIGFAVPGLALPPSAPAEAAGSGASDSGTPDSGTGDSGASDSGADAPEAGIPVSVIPAPTRPGPGTAPVPLGGITVGEISVSGTPVNGIRANGIPSVNGAPLGTIQAGAVPAGGLPAGASPAGATPAGAGQAGTGQAGAGPPSAMPALAFVAAGTGSLGTPAASPGLAVPAPPSSIPAPVLPADLPTDGAGLAFGRPQPVTPHAGAPAASSRRVTTPVSPPVGRPRPPASRVYQSVLTGNVRQIAEVKLTAVGLRHPLDLCIGAYGEDHEDRTELVHLARRRASGVYGSSASDFAGHATIVVGDTPLDIEAALAADARAVGVATGSYSAADLRAAGAHAVLDDLTSTPAVLAALLTSLSSLAS